MLVQPSVGVEVRWSVERVRRRLLFLLDAYWAMIYAEMRHLELGAKMTWVLSELLSFWFKTGCLMREMGGDLGTIVYIFHKSIRNYQRVREPACHSYQFIDRSSFRVPFPQLQVVSKRRKSRRG